MKLKHALWATGIWTVVALGISFALIAYIVAHPVPGTSMKQRGEIAGQSMGVVVGIGYSLIWLPFAWRMGKQRREAGGQKTRNRPERTPED